MATEHERRLSEYASQVGELQAEIKYLEEEAAVLTRKLLEAPARVRTLEERMLETKGHVMRALSEGKVQPSSKEEKEFLFKAGK